MSYQAIFDSGALREFDKLPKAMQRRLGKVVDDLEKDPRPIGAQKLTDIDAYKMRVGDYRIVYAIRDDLLIVLVVKVGNRREIYKDMGAIRKRLKK